MEEKVSDQEQNLENTPLTAPDFHGLLQRYAPFANLFKVTFTHRSLYRHLGTKHSATWKPRRALGAVRRKWGIDLT